MSKSSEILEDESKRLLLKALGIGGTAAIVLGVGGLLRFGLKDNREEISESKPFDTSAVEKVDGQTIKIPVVSDTNEKSFKTLDLNVHSDPAKPTIYISQSIPDAFETISGSVPKEVRKRIPLSSRVFGFNNMLSKTFLIHPTSIGIRAKGIEQRALLVGDKSPNPIWTADLSLGKEDPETIALFESGEKVYNFFASKIPLIGRQVIRQGFEEFERAISRQGEKKIEEIKLQINKEYSITSIPYFIPGKKTGVVEIARQFMIPLTGIKKGQIHPVALWFHLNFGDSSRGTLDGGGTHKSAYREAKANFFVGGKPKPKPEKKGLEKYFLQGRELEGADLAKELTFIYGVRLKRSSPHILTSEEILSLKKTWADIKTPIFEGLESAGVMNYSYGKNPNGGERIGCNLSVLEFGDDPSLEKFLSTFSTRPDKNFFFRNNQIGICFHRSRVYAPSPEQERAWLRSLLNWEKRIRAQVLIEPTEGSLSRTIPPKESPDFFINSLNFLDPFYDMSDPEIKKWFNKQNFQSWVGGENSSSLFNREEFAYLHMFPDIKDRISGLFKSYTR